MSNPIDMFSGMVSQARPPNGSSSTSSSEDAGQQFELMMAELLIKEMRKSMPEGGLFGGSEMETFTEMLDQELAQRLTEGKGLGLKAQISDALERAGHTIRRLPRHEPFEGGLPVKGVQTSSFGLRRDPFTGKRDHHPGLDIAADRGTAIHAPRDGVVSWAGTVAGYGRVVYVDHGDGLQTRYAHCDRLEVQQGDAVNVGDTLATVGSSGRSTGPHLHFEVRQDGVAVDPDGFFSEKSDAPPQDLFR